MKFICHTEHETIHIHYHSEDELVSFNGCACVPLQDAFHHPAFYAYYNNKLQNIHAIMNDWDIFDDEDRIEPNFLSVMQHAVELENPHNIHPSVRLEQGYEDLIIINHIRYFMYRQGSLWYMLHCDETHHLVTEHEQLYAAWIGARYASLFFEHRFTTYNKPRSLELPPMRCDEHLQLIAEYHMMHAMTPIPFEQWYALKSASQTIPSCEESLLI